MKKLLLFLLIASLLLSFTCSKKTYNYYYPQEKGALAGLVSPPNSNARVSAWQGIEIASTYIDTTTGYFKISELPIGTYSIKVEAEGYETYESKSDYVVYSGGTTSVGAVNLLPLIAGMVIKTYPMNATTNVPLKTYIEIWFSKDMDTASVENAFNINPPTEGEFSWSIIKRGISIDTAYGFGIFDTFEITEVNAKTAGAVGKRTLRFYPSSSLRTNTTYTITLDTTAHDTSGAHLEEPFVFSFTTEGIRIISISPPDKSLDVSTFTNIRVRFNTPMDQASVVSAFSISPSIEGEFSWNGLDQLVFMPNDVLASNSNYVVTIDTTAQDLYGSKFGKVFTTDFNTEPIRVLYARPQNGATYVEPTSSIMVQFNTSMDQLATVNAFRMIDSDSNLVSGTFSWYGLGGFYFYPDTTLKNNKEYVVTVSDQAKDIHGIAMPKTFRLWFKTKP